MLNNVFMVYPKFKASLLEDKESKMSSVNKGFEQFDISRNTDVDNIYKSELLKKNSVIVIESNPISKNTKTKHILL